ncbi:MAG: SDR family oxidoreductase [Deltaproteobacteria bacterium]|nr:SDR family oxidoreductase [Deltaproteobacteria bacterium]
MNICISGALGHIGSKLIRNLSIPNLSRVHLVDNLLTQRYVSLFDLPDQIDFIFHPIDIQSQKMEALVKESDVLIHLAAVTDATKSFERMEEVEEINKIGFEYVANLCADAGCSLLFPSTTSVYGSQSEIVDESVAAEELKPQSPYAESKIFGENLMAGLSRKKGLKFVTMRIGTIFGYAIGMRFHTAVNKFIWQASTGHPVSVWKTALHQKRPYCDLDDCVRAINFFVSNNVFDNQIYNIVTENLTVQHIIDAIRNHVPDIQIEFVDSPIMNQLSYEVSNKKSRELGLTYHGNIEAGIHDSLLKLKNVNAEIRRI